MNIWALPKDPPIRSALSRLSGNFDMRHLVLDCSDNQNRRAIRICDCAVTGLSAYLFTFGQSQSRYGLQLEYPTTAGVEPPYDTQEELQLKRVIELLAMHFEVT